MLGQKYVRLNDKGYKVSFYKEVGCDEEKGLIVLRFVDNIVVSYIGVSNEDLLTNYFMKYSDVVRCKEKLENNLLVYKTFLELKNDMFVKRFIRTVKECKNELQLWESVLSNLSEYSIKKAQLEKGIRRARKVLWRYRTFA